MTITAERPTYVGSRRYADRPAEARAARHRATEAVAVALAAQLAELVVEAGRTLALFARGVLIVLSGSWAARTTARAAVVVAVSAFLLAAMLFGSVLVMVEPLRSGPRPAIVTPSPTPFPGGWTYGT